MDFEDKGYQQKCEEIRNANQELLDIFAKDMVNLSSKTIQKHLSNVSFYINDYLLCRELLTFENGIKMIDSYLGYFFIEKCMWSTPASIKTTAASIKKFYKSMMDHNKISKKQYHELECLIKEGLPDWQAECAQYNDPNQENPFDIFF